MSNAIGFHKNYRRGSWSFDHPLAVDQMIAMYLDDSTIQQAIDVTGCPRTTAQGLKARVTKHQNEQRALQAAHQPRLHNAVALWVPA